MLESAAIDSRLREMRTQPDPTLSWDEQCEGSARALLVFVGPSPGYNPNDLEERHPRKRNCNAALWNVSYTDPLGWAGGFRVGFRPLVEATLFTSYAKAGKLIGRANLDWFGNPNAADVPAKFMHEGGPSVLKMIADCAPQLILPMEQRTFDILRNVMERATFAIKECEVKEFKVRISNAAKSRFHSYLCCFRATSAKGHSVVVVKLPQHPVWMFQADYGTRCGKAIRKAARQIASGQPVDVTMT